MAKSYGRIYQNKSNVSITPFDIYNLYPVGSIYMSINSTNPSNYFGGTWEQIKDRFLLACGDNYDNGVTGGEATHKHISPLTWYVPKGSNTAYIGTTNEYKYTPRVRDVYAATVDIRNNAPSTWKELLAYYTSTENNMPPYITVYIWKRVA